MGELKANKYPGKQIIPQGELSQQFKEKVLHFHGVVQWPLELRPELSENECAGWLMVFGGEGRVGAHPSQKCQLEQSYMLEVSVAFPGIRRRPVRLEMGRPEEMMPETSLGS